jgi:uncharacterized protein YbcI
MNTQGEAEGQISSDFSRFYSEMFGRGPTAIRVNSMNSIIVIMTQNIFTSADKMLVLTEVGRKLVVDIRKGLIESSRIELTKIVHDATGEDIQNIHHDFSTTNAEEAFLFSLGGVPHYRLNVNGKHKVLH